MLLGEHKPFYEYIFEYILALSNNFQVRLEQFLDQLSASELSYYTFISEGVNVLVSRSRYAKYKLLFQDITYSTYQLNLVKPRVKHLPGNHVTTDCKIATGHHDYYQEFKI